MSDPRAAAGKSDGALLTIAEVSAATGVAPHILRYWESRFTQLRPLTRAGNRRYYRPDDVALVRRIATALDRDGYTIKGVQQLLDARPVKPIAAGDAAPPIADELRRIRDMLRAALAD